MRALENTRMPFLSKYIIVEVLSLFLCFKSNSRLTPEIESLQFCPDFKSSSQPYFNIFFDDSCHL